PRSPRESDGPAADTGVSATMGRMRVLLAGALTALAVIASGCGSSPAGTAIGATLAGAPATPLPARAVACASVDCALGPTHALRAAQSGRSLADTSTFQAAWSSLSGDLLAQVYVNPPSSGAKGTHADWIAADVRADSDALRIDAVVKPTSARSAPAGASLLGDVPSGASLAISFRGGADLEAKLSSLQPPKELGTSL